MTPRTDNTTPTAPAPSFYQNSPYYWPAFLLIVGVGAAALSLVLLTQ